MGLGLGLGLGEHAVGPGRCHELDCVLEVNLRGVEMISFGLRLRQKPDGEAATEAHTEAHAEAGPEAMAQDQA